MDKTPQGWKLVPIACTPEQIDAAEGVYFSGYTGTPTASPEDVYAAMVAAAPDYPWSACP